MRKSFLQKICLSALFVPLLLGIFPAPASASVVKTIWSIVNADEGLDMREWIKAAFISAVVEMGNELIFGMNSDDIAKCDGNWGNGECVLEGDDILSSEDSSESLINPHVSMLSFAISMNREISTARPPLNFALFWKDVASQSPLFPAKTARADIFSDVFEGVHTVAGQIAQEVFDDVVLKLWKQSRNVAYFFFIVVMVIGGFLIMFRREASPRTVVTVQYLIPRVIVGIVGVTFSYAIVSLGVEFANLLQVLGYGLVGNVIPDLLSGADPLYPLLNVVIALFPPVGLFYAVIVFVILLTILLIAFAFFFGTISRFVKFVLLAVAGPIVLAWASIPGQEEVGIDWFRGVVSNTLAIPAMFIVYWLGWAVVVTSVFTASNPLAFFISLILGVGLMWKARSVPKIIDSAIGAPSFYIPGKVKKK